MWVPFPAQAETIQVKPILEVRERFERRVDRDFDRSKADGRSELLSRFRVGFNWSAGPAWSGDLVYQYAHGLVWTGRANFSNESSDLLLVNVTHKSDFGSATVGRQKLAVGSERLIGSLEWANTSRTFDGVRVKTKGVDAFALTIPLAPTPQYDARIVGANLKWFAGDTLALYKHDVVSGSEVSVWHLSHDWRKKVGNVVLEIEAALQAGRRGGRRLEAWAMHTRAAVPVAPKATVYAEIDVASGGGSASTTRTFDNLYPTNHKFYGSADMQGWRNMTGIEIGVEANPTANLNLKVHWHRFWLRDPSDAWYGAGGSPNVRPGGVYIDPTGASGNEVGSELDVDATYRLTPRASLTAGLAVFSPGSFVRSVNSGRADRQVWWFVAVQARF